MSILRCLCGVVCLLWSLPLAQASPSKQGCLKLFQQKSYVAAGRCYEKKLPDSLSLKSLPEARRITYGRLLRNAALAYRAAGRTTKQIERSSYFYERALKHLERYLNDKLYETKYRKQSAESLLLAVRGKVQYTPLTIIGESAGVTLLLKGFQFEQTFKGRWSKNVRPGRYTLSEKAPQGKKARTFQLVVSPKQPKIFVVPRLPVVRRQPVRQRPMERRVKIPPPRKPPPDRPPPPNHPPPPSVPPPPTLPPPSPIPPSMT